MIVRITDHEILLITQPDHAVLAAAIVAGWRADGLPHSSRREEIVLATREHDNGWADEDREPAVDTSTGRILDFVTIPLEVRQRIWPRGIERLRRTPYVAALVAQHALTVYDRYRTDPAWSQFFAGLETTRQQLLDACAPAGLESLQRDYFFVNVGDLASLIFCNGWTAPHRAGRYALKLEDGRLLIAPDPFDGDEVPMAVTARRLPGGPVRSQEEARDLFERAATFTVAGRAVGVPSL